ncbi:PEGA domain-containing protein [candidate division CSSED10-310 bacterium]|uniref:PEGA domain-containing protein n=1 Tax=candidate division CSSED10-310 bacterium TaxID=2855610 RepID=A0ABV6Z6U5_UNCC1
MKKIVIVLFLFFMMLTNITFLPTETMAYHIGTHLKIDPCHSFWILNSFIGYHGDWGYLDLDVTPEDAQVYIDGVKIGICDQFDGFPEYLYLKSGTYRLTFKKEGYLDYEREITVSPGLEIEFNTHLKKAPHQDKQSPAEQPEVFFFEELKERKQDNTAVESQKKTAEKENMTLPVKSTETTEKSSKQTPDLQKHDPKETETPGAAISDTKGTLRIKVFPKNATIYIDRTFVGTAQILNAKENGIELPAGKHTIAIMMPGYQTIQQEIEIKAAHDNQLRAILVADVE